MAPQADVAVIGGSGFYSFLDHAVEVDVATPYGAPSGPVTVGEIEGRSVAFVARHGTRHQWAAHRVNYRANLWALRQLGVRRVIAPCAVGSLRPDLHPGDFVVLDQLVDRTWGRADTFLEGETVEHISFADPYCPALSDALAAAAPPGSALRVGGTVGVVNGPRFSTRAESRSNRDAGWDVVNMTQYPEAYLARELGMCYAGLALVTDYDTGVDEDASSDAVTMEAVMAVLAANVARARELVSAAIRLIPSAGSCNCADGGARSVSGP